MNERPSPTSTPSVPPSPASTVDSSRNCCRIARRVAPMALRMPISRVRSVTDTSMMFATPIPPTTSEMPAIAVVNSVRNVRNCDAWSMKSCWARASKSRSVVSVIRWRSSRIALTCSSATGTAAADGAVTMMLLTSSVPPRT